jgi:hypothetical protein
MVRREILFVTLQGSLAFVGFSQKKVNDGKGTLSQNQFCFVLPLLVLSGKKSDP